MSFTKISGFDYLRVLASFSVVIIHVSFTNETLNNIHLTEFAVPSFIMMSIFLLGFNSELSYKQIFTKVFKRIFLQYSAWTIIYLSLRYIKSIFLNEEFNIGFGEIFLGGSSVHLWFLPALLLWQVIMSFFYKINNFIVDILLCILLFIIGYLYNYFNSDRSSFLNLFTYYSGYIIIGKIIFNKLNVFRNFASKYYLLLIVFLSLLIVIKSIYKINDLDFYLIDILYSTSIFLFFAVYTFRLSRFVNKLSKFSFGIYLSHFIFYQAIYSLLVFSKIEITMIITIINIIITFFVSYLFCYILNKSNLLSKII